jgi:hypothetical protein
VKLTQIFLQQRLKALAFFPKKLCWQSWYLEKHVAKAEKEVAEVKGCIESYLAEQENFYQFAEAKPKFLRNTKRKSKKK